MGEQKNDLEIYQNKTKHNLLDRSMIEIESMQVGNSWGRELSGIVSELNESWCLSFGALVGGALMHRPPKV